MFSLLITFQIINLKMIGDVFVLRKCYRCGGETLGPVVKHSVRDNNLGKIQSTIDKIRSRYSYLAPNLAQCDRWKRLPNIAVEDLLG